MSKRPSTKEFQTLTREVKRIFGDESGVQLDATDILRWANDAQMEIVSINGPLKARSTTTSVAGQKVYTFPSEKIQQIASLQYDGRLLPNTPFPEAQRIIISRDPQNVATGTPELWYEWAGEFSLWPTPESARPIDLFYSAYPADLTGDPNQTLSVSDSYYSAVVNYILSKAYEMDEEPQLSQMAEQRFRDSVQQQGDSERQAQDGAYPVIQEVEYE